jgi:RHS repeat-associated protein
MTYIYDSENHMISANGNGKSITMVYDAFGNRVSKTVNGVTTKYLVEDDVNPTGLPQVLEEVQNGAAVRTYTYGLQRISESQFIDNVWTASFYGYDGGGNVRQLINSTGTVTDEYEYDAYGNSFTKSGTTPNNYLYRGEQYDADLGLYYLRARYYNPSTGRFMGRDPFAGKRSVPATLHKYLYTGGDPVNWIDPRGSDEEGYALRLQAAQFGTRFIATIGCGASLGFYVAAAQLDMNSFESGLEENGTGTAAVAIGCAYMLLPSLFMEGVPEIAVNIGGVIGCVNGIEETVHDYNQAGVTDFGSDVLHSVFDCGIAGLGSRWAVGGYFD